MSKRKTLAHCKRQSGTTTSTLLCIWTPSCGERVTTHSCDHVLQQYDEQLCVHPTQRRHCSRRFQTAPHAHQHRCQRLQTMSDRTCITHNTKTVPRLPTTNNTDANKRSTPCCSAVPAPPAAAQTNNREWPWPTRAPWVSLLAAVRMLHLVR